MAKALSIGTQLGEFRITGTLGAGGMGEVYRATDSSLGREVAIKVLSPEFADDESWLNRFEREAKLLATLNHAHIGSVYRLGRFDGTRYLAMELVAGETLEARLRNGPLPIEDALHLAIQIAAALEAAHQKGVIHRDLKPANIMVAPDGVVKVVDFGLAKAMQAGSGDSMQPAGAGMAETRQGVVLGTASYMSPEQASGQTMDQRTDIWSFGVVLYEMLTGMPVFTGESVPHLLAEILKSEPVWDRLPHSLDSRIAQLLKRCLTKKLRNRYHSIADVRIELESVSNSPPVGAAVTDDRATSGEQFPSMIAMAIAALGIVGVTVLLTRALLPTGEEALAETRLDIVTPPTTSPASFALSPDGGQIVFVADGDNGAQLWLRRLDQVEAEPVEGTEGASFPFWAPDSSAVAFFADGQLRRVSVAGGQLATIAEAPSTRGGSWGSDGVIVYAPEPVGSLVRVDASGNTRPVPVTILESEAISHRWPSFLPDGRRFLYGVMLPTGFVAGVYLGSIDGGESVRVGDSDAHAAFVPPGHVLTIADGALVAHAFDAVNGRMTGDPVTIAESVGYQTNGLGAFSASSMELLAFRSIGDSPRELVWFDRNGVRVGTIEGVDDSVPTDVTLTQDGTRIALTRWVQGNIDIWLHDEARGFSRATDSASVDMSPVWSPDSTRIVYGSNRDGQYGIFSKSVALGGDERPVHLTSTNSWPQDLSSDGRLLLYTEEDADGVADLWVLPLVGSDAAPVSLGHTSFDETQAQFSPDGKWIAYGANRSGVYEVWVQPFPNPDGVRQQLSTRGGAFPVWSHDGSELFYLSPDNTLMAVRVLRADDTFDYLEPVELFPTKIVRTGTNLYPAGPFSTAQYDVSADGLFLMNIDAGDVVVPINIVQGWAGAQ